MQPQEPQSAQASAWQQAETPPKCDGPACDRGLCSKGLCPGTLLLIGFLLVVGVTNLITWLRA